MNSLHVDLSGNVFISPSLLSVENVRVAPPSHLSALCWANRSGPLGKPPIGVNAVLMQTQGKWAPTRHTVSVPFTLCVFKTLPN